eukprot:121772_1
MHDGSWNVAHEIVFLSTIIMIAFVTLMLCIMLLRSVFKFYAAKETIIKSIKLSTIFALSMAILSVISDLYHVERAYTLYQHLHQDMTFHEIRAASDFFMFLSLLAFFINLYVRLIKSVEGTSFSVSKAFKWTLYILLIIVVILDLFYVITLVFKMAHYDTFSVYIYGLFTYFHVFFFVIIVCKFVYKLREVHKACVA